MPPAVSAAADPVHVTLYQPFANDRNAPADGVSKVRMYIMAYTPLCGGTYSNQETCPDGSTPTRRYLTEQTRINFFVSDSSVQLQGPLQQAADGSYYGTTGTGAYAGSIDFTMTATTAGDKTVTASFAGRDQLPPAPSVSAMTVPFTKVASDAPTIPTTTTGTSTTTGASVNVPVVPSLDEVRVDGETFDFQSNDTLTVKYGKTVSLKGTTIPKGTVTLYIHSALKEASVTADDRGEWTYDVKNLESGDHYIEAEVFDSATQQKSARQTILTFAVSKQLTTAATTSGQSSTGASGAKSTSKMPFVVAGLVLVAVILGGVVIYRRKRRSRGAPAVPAEEALASADQPPSVQTTETPEKSDQPKKD